jgi:predicted nucleic acid-binding protein
MILYLDTSSLVKLYIDEDHSDLVHAWADQAEALCTSRVAYPETMAAVARRWREGDLEDEAFEAIRQAVVDEWPDFSTVELDERAAGDLAIRHGLRGFDAIHLAAAVDVFAGAGAAPTRFSSFDQQLNHAARAEGMIVLDASSDRDAMAAEPAATEEPVQDP